MATSGGSSPRGCRLFPFGFYFAGLVRCIFRSSARFPGSGRMRWPSPASWRRSFLFRSCFPGGGCRLRRSARSETFCQGRRRGLNPGLSLWRSGAARSGTSAAVGPALGVTTFSRGLPGGLSSSVLRRQGYSAFRGDCGFLPLWLILQVQSR